MTRKNADTFANETSAGLRLDKWLWHARFFKSRAQATDAVTGGLVHLNDERVKPAREVRVGDQLHVTRGEERFEVIVRSLPSRRGPAIEAQRAYEETPDSVIRRERKREQLRIAPPAPDGRPDKHARRELRNLRRG
ncbi:MAG: RNA-binding S4 domain-containing protein [Candidatus Obscuribacterales bacterium]|nr:RNA-binding S4 domain-containing protein [Steroidobacteraceae bacterium]